MNTLGAARIGRDVEVRSLTSGKKPASQSNGQTGDYQKIHLASSPPLGQVPKTLAQTAAPAASTVKSTQNLAIKAAPAQHTNANSVGTAYYAWANMPAGTYADYSAKMAAAKNNPTSAWLTAGATPLAEADWNAKQGRVAADQARGVVFGGSSGDGVKASLA